MNYLSYAFKFIYRIKWWLLIFPPLVAYLVFLKIGQVPRTFKSATTIYTGIVSGYDIESAGGNRQDWNIINNAMDNLTNIIQSQNTLKNVSLRLYAQDLVHGDPNEDNQYIMAKNYRRLLAKTPDDVKALIDRNSDSITVQNLRRYEVADHDNHIYGLFMWNHPHYSYLALSQIQVKRVGSSDMLEISYENDDPGIVYNTLLLLCDEFVDQYKDLRFGETNNVIGYFESELRRVGNTLHEMEDSLRDYNIEHRVINYEEQTKHVAALSRDYELRNEEISLNLESAQRLRKTIEDQLGGLQTFRNNTRFLEKVREISSLHSRISAAEAFANENNVNTQEMDEDAPKGGKTLFQPSARTDMDQLRGRLSQQTKELQQITNDIAAQQYTKEGLSANSMISQWLDAVLLEEKSKAEMAVMNSRKKDIDDRYTIFSPIGSTLKRKNRAIGFSEQSYLSILQALNTARLRQKNLQMTSATLKVINPPVLPISAEPSKRKMMVYAAFACTFVFILAFFILLEILDRTLRDKFRTERITGARVLGAFPAAGGLRNRRYAQIYREIASQYMNNAALNYFHPGKPNIINFISTEPGDGKSTLMENMAAHLRETGMKVRTASWNTDFDTKHKDYLLAAHLSDFIHDTEGEVSLAEADVVLVEYPAFSVASTPKELLQEASLNILVAPANRTWKDTDQLLYDKALALAGDSPLMICLNNAKRDVVQNFTGLMPPHSWLRRMSYQIGQFGFTASK